MNPQQSPNFGRVVSESGTGQGFAGGVDLGCTEGALNHAGITVVSVGSKAPHNPQQHAAQAAGATGGGQYPSGEGPLIAAPAAPHATKNQHHWHNIPEILRQRPQWCFSFLGSKAPLNPRTGKPASVTNPATWSTFDAACNAARYTRGQIGYVLHAGGPFSSTLSDSI